MLGDRGPGALDWLAHDLQQIGPATELGLWAREYLGMQVAVWDGSAYRPVTRIADTGPVAWSRPLPRSAFTCRSRPTSGCREALRSVDGSVEPLELAAHVWRAGDHASLISRVGA